MRQRLRHMIRKEFIQTVREPRMRTLLFLPPLIQLLIFGYAVNLDVDTARIAWMDQDNSPQSRALLSEFQGSGRFILAAAPSNASEMQELLDRGKVDGVVRVLPGFARDIERGRATSVQVLLDGTNSNTASIVAAYASQTIGRYSSEVMLERQREKLVGGTMMSGGPIRAAVPQVEGETRVWFNPDLRSRNYFIPGVVVNIIMLVTLSLTAMAIVREKEIGTIEQIMVTPIGRLEFILGKTIPFALIGFLDVILISLVAVFWFDVPIEGDPLLLLASTGLYLMSTLGVGLFISTVSRTQQQAMMTAFFFMQPAILLSGFIYPIANMPAVIRWLTYLNPLRYFLVIIRGVFLKGVGVQVLWPQMAGLAVLGTILLALASTRFKKTMA
jgi:ABC-2 type transport system permease protein